MSRTGNGEYVAPNSSWKPAVNGTLATASDWNSLLADLSAALTQSVSRDGQSPMQGNLPMGNNKVTGLAPGAGTGEALAFQQLFSQGTMADIASAATTDIGVQNTSFLRVTGTTTITSFGTSFRGPRFLTFEGAVTLTHSSTLVLPGGANITTAAGDSLIVIPGATLGTADKWVVMAYQKNAVPGTVDIPDGSITAAKLADTAAVKLTLDQTIAGVKTFSSSPVVPNATASGQAVNKGQLDAITSVGQLRAWVNFNGTGAVAIRASGNVSSITDNGTGDYTVNFTTGMSDANYGVLGLAVDNLQTSSNSANYTTSTVRCFTVTSSNTSIDSPFVFIGIVR